MNVGSVYEESRRGNRWCGDAQGQAAGAVV